MRGQSANGELTIEELRVAFPDVEFRVFPSARIESGELQGAIDLRGKNSSRSCVRIPRESVISFLEARQIIATTDTLARRGDKHRNTRVS